MKLAHQKGSPKLVPQRYYAVAATNTPVLLSEVPANLVSFVFENNDPSNTCYCQVFDAASTGAVTLGSTAPDWTFMVPPGGIWGRDPQDEDLQHCLQGLVIAVTSTRTGAGACTIAPTLTVWYDRS